MYIQDVTTLDYYNMANIACFSSLHCLNKKGTIYWKKKNDGMQTEIIMLTILALEKRVFVCNVWRWYFVVFSNSFLTYYWMKCICYFNDFKNKINSKLKPVESLNFQDVFYQLLP